MNKIYVLGIGPGSPDYLLPIVKKKAAECHVLLGGRRALELFHDLGKQEILLDARLDHTLTVIREMREHCQVGVLVSGDPGFYSFLANMLTVFTRDEIEVYPGITSLQYLFAKGVLPWQEAFLTSLHGRRIEELAALVSEHSRVAFLTDPAFPVSAVARVLLEKGVTGKRILVGEDLSYPQEKVTDLPLKEWIDQKVSTLAVMVIYDG